VSEPTRSAIPPHVRIVGIVVAEILFVLIIGFIGLIAMALWFSDWFPPPPFHDMRVLTGTILVGAGGLDLLLVFAKRMLFSALAVKEKTLRYIRIWNGIIIGMTLLPTILVFLLTILSEGENPV
jgi:hypothetical protein